MECPYCNGEGEIMDGIYMHPNPYDYSSYDEIWRPCAQCNGRGRAWTLPAVRSFIYRFQSRLKKLKGETEIPF